MVRNKGKRLSLRKASLILVLLTVVGVSLYALYGSYKLKQLSEMTFEDMLAYTTEGRSEARITVGIIQNGEMSYTVYGEDAAVYPPEEKLYEIGSITKTFTTSLLCKAISEDRIQLNDSIDDYLSLPAKAHYPTIRSLVTHTSGYKAYYFEQPMITNFFKKENDFNGITNEMLISKLGEIEVDDSVHPFKYSNFGTSVLGAVLSEIYGQEYAPMMNEYLSEDLELNNSKISDGSGIPANYWEWSETDAYLPAGAILSTITDMMHYTKMQISENPAYLSMAHEALIEVDGSPTVNQKMDIFIDSMAVGWLIDSEHNIIWHNGGTSYSNSYLGFDKEKQIAVVILSNLAPDYRIPATVMGVEILTSLQD